LGRMLDYWAIALASAALVRVHLLDWANSI